MGVKAIKEFNGSDHFQTQELWEQCNEKCKTQCSHRTQTQPQVMEKEFSVPVLTELFPEKWINGHMQPCGLSDHVPHRSITARVYSDLSEFSKPRSLLLPLTQIRPSALCIAPQSWGKFFPVPLLAGSLVPLLLVLSTRASLVAQTVKNPPAMQETGVQSLGREDSLEEGMTTHSSILAWRILWTEEPGDLQSMGSQRVRHEWMTPTTLVPLELTKETQK